MMEAASTTKTSVNIYQTTLRNNPEDSHLYIRRHENLKSHTNHTIVPIFLAHTVERDVVAQSVTELHLLLMLYYVVRTCGDVEWHITSQPANSVSARSAVIATSWP
jgi:hypothetical protein